MKLEAQYSSDGCNSLLMSPANHYEHDTIIEIDLFLIIDALDFAASLNVMVTNEAGFPIVMFDAINATALAGEDSGQQKVSVCMPTGTHRLLIRGTTGMNTSPKLIVDNVVVTDQKCIFNTEGLMVQGKCMRLKKNQGC
jgi:hypothetical protein